MPSLVYSICRELNPDEPNRHLLHRESQVPRSPSILSYLQTNTPSRFLRPLGLRVHDIGSDRQMKIISHAITATDSPATAISEKTICTAPPPPKKKTRHRQTGPLNSPLAGIATLRCQHRLAGEIQPSGTNRSHHRCPAPDCTTATRTPYSSVNRSLFS